MTGEVDTFFQNLTGAWNNSQKFNGKMIFSPGVADGHLNTGYWDRGYNNHLSKQMPSRLGKKSLRGNSRFGIIKLFIVFVTDKYQKQ